jgi:hypothetical protein
MFIRFLEDVVKTKRAGKIISARPSAYFTSESSRQVVVKFVVSALF